MPPPYLLVRRKPFKYFVLKNFRKVLDEIFEGSMYKGGSVPPSSATFLDKNSPRGEVLHHLRKKSVIKYLKGTPNKKKVMLNRSIVGGFLF